MSEEAVRGLAIPADAAYLDARNGNPAEDLHWDRAAGWVTGRPALEALLSERYEEGLS